MHSTPAQWRRAARQLHHLHGYFGDSCRCQPATDPEGVAQRLRAVERCYGLDLPPSYKAFMLEFDGWHRAYRDTSLLSSAQLLNPTWHHRAELVLDRCAAVPWPGHDGAACSWRDNVVPIGLDDAGTTIFVLDTSVRQADGEVEAIAWIADLGIRAKSFAGVLELMCDLTASQGGMVAAESSAWAA